jgi:hypothetical protein
MTFMSSQEIAAPRGRTLFLGCTERASQPRGICRNVIGVNETPIKITIADTVVTARLVDIPTARDLAAQLPLTLIWSSTKTTTSTSQSNEADRQKGSQGS